MVKVASVAIFLTGAILLAPANLAFADSTQPGSDDTDGAQTADPNDQPDMISPDPNTDGSATIDVPPIEVPGEDTDDYSPPDSEDDPAGDAPAPSGDSGD